MANKELLKYIEENSDKIEKTEVVGNTKKFLDQIEKGLKLYGTYIDDYDRVHKSESGMKQTSAPIIDTINGFVVMPDHTKILDSFAELKYGDLVIVSVNDIKYDKSGKPVFYDWNVELINKDTLPKEIKG